MSSEGSSVEQRYGLLQHTAAVVTRDGKFTADETKQGIIDHLKLRQPVYCPTAAYGHFGRKEFAREQVDTTDELLARANI